MSDWQRTSDPICTGGHPSFPRGMGGPSFHLGTQHMWSLLMPQGLGAVGSHRRRSVVPGAVAQVLGRDQHCRQGNGNGGHQCGHLRAGVGKTPGAGQVRQHGCCPCPYSRDGKRSATDAPVALPALFHGLVSDRHTGQTHSRYPQHCSRCPVTQ